MENIKYPELDQGDQLYVNFELLHSHFNWTTHSHTWSVGRWGKELQKDLHLDRTATAHVNDGMWAGAGTGGTPLTIRVLNAWRWPRDQEWTPSATYTGCVYHPYIKGHNHDNKSASYRAAFGRWGLWYVPP